MKKLTELIDELESFIPEQEKLNMEVSSGSIGWHIEHCLLTVEIVIEKLRQSVPKEYSPKFYFWKHVVLLSQKIPRGKVKAPRVVQPKNNHTNQSLSEHVAVVRSRLTVLDSLERNHHFPHPFLGQMNLGQAVKFLRIHTWHHLKIIKKIGEFSDR